jgi:hypothetical protein
MNLDLRPLTVSEFLDRTFSIYRHRFLLFVGLMAPQAVLSLIVAMLMGWAQSSLRTAEDFEIERLTVLVVGVGVGALLFSILHWVLYVVGAGAIAAAVSDLYGRARPEVGSSYAAATRRLGSLLWATFLMAVRVVGVIAAAMLPGALILGLAGGANVLQPDSTGTWASLLIVGLLVLGLGATAGFAVMIYMGLRYAVAIPTVVLEPIGGRDAIRRSIRLTTGLLGRALLLMICGIVITHAAAMVLQMPFMIGMLIAGPETRAGFWLNMAGTATGAAGQTLTGPVFAIGVAVLYFEARIRHEALDLQVMTEALAPPAMPAARSYAPAPPPVPN